MDNLVSDLSIKVEKKEQKITKLVEKLNKKDEDLKRLQYKIMLLEERLENLELPDAKVCTQYLKVNEQRILLKINFRECENLLDDEAFNYIEFSVVKKYFHPFILDTMKRVGRRSFYLALINYEVFMENENRFNSLSKRTMIGYINFNLLLESYLMNTLGKKDC